MAYLFDDFRLDEDKHELTRAGSVIALEPRSFAVLLTLVQTRGTVLTKAELIDAVWGGRFTSDEAIAARVKDARKAIGDDGKSQRLIKTVHGVGYRFVAEVRDVAASRAAVLEESQVADEVPDSRPVLVVMPIEDAKQPGSIAATGLTHDVIIGLSRLRWLKVISWASTMRLQQGDQQLLRPLTAADYCLAAQLSHQGGRRSLFVELSSLKDNVVVWADRFETSIDNINQLRSDVVDQAVAALELQISAAEAAKTQYLHTDNLDAWSNYHLGLQHMYRFNAADNALSTDFFKRAITLQPDFARAHAGLSFAQFQTVFNRYVGPNLADCQRSAIASAERSVELDANDPMTNFVMGRSFWLGGDVASGQIWLERALAISRNFAQAHYAYGLAGVMLDDASSVLVDAHSEASAAISLSPLDPFTYGFYGVRALSFLRDGRLQDAMFWANRAARQPNAIAAMDFIAAAANQLAGEKSQAKAWALRARERSSNADSDYFFRALPFMEGDLRSSLGDAFDAVGLAAH